MRKRAALLGAFVCAVLLSFSAQADTYTVISAMNFRSMPGVTYQSIGSVPLGATVDVLGSDNGWDYVCYNGVYGWIHGGNVVAGTVPVTTQTQTQTQTQTASASSGTGQTVTVLYGMNFRAAPGMDGQIMTTVPAGTTVQYLGSSNGWDQIRYNGMEGWIAGGRITTQQPSATTQNTATGTQTSTTSTTSTTSYSYGNRVSDAMNFRAAPGLTGTVMGIIPVGSSVQVLGSENGWDKVSYQGTVGWIKSGNLQ